MGSDFFQQVPSSINIRTVNQSDGQNDPVHKRCDSESDPEEAEGLARAAGGHGGSEKMERNARATEGGRESGAVCGFTGGQGGGVEGQEERICGVVLEHTTCKQVWTSIQETNYFEHTICT